MTIATTSSLKRLKLRSGEVRNLAEVLVYLTEVTTERLTVQQLTFFLVAALAEARGAPALLKDIQESIGVATNSLTTTYKIWLEPTRQFPHAVEFLEQETDKHDKRRKYLRLTEKGCLVMLGALERAAGQLKENRLDETETED